MTLIRMGTIIPGAIIAGVSLRRAVAGYGGVSAATAMRIVRSRRMVGDGRGDAALSGHCGCDAATDRAVAGRSMTGGELTAALAALGWSKGQLGALLGCDRTLVHYWATERARVPPAVGRWLRRAVTGLRSAGPPPVDWRVRLDLVAGDEVDSSADDLVEISEHDHAEELTGE